MTEEKYYYERMSLLILLVIEAHQALLLVNSAIQRDVKNFLVRP